MRLKILKRTTMVVMIFFNCSILFYCNSQLKTPDADISYERLSIPHNEVTDTMHIPDEQRAVMVAL